MDIRDTEFLLDYNIETYNNITELLKDNSSCAVVQPTGTGKSYIMMKMLYDYKDDWKIVIAPSRDFLNNLENNAYWTNEKTLTLTYSYIGINCDNIESALAEYKINKENVGLIIIDEMHRAGAPKWGAGVKNLMKVCKNAKTLGLTATPKRYDENRDMVEELFDNRLAQNMNLGKAIELGIIPKLNYVVGMHKIDFNIDEILCNIPGDKGYDYIRNKIESYRNKWEFSKYFVDTIKKYINFEDKKGKHIVFASSIEEAENMRELIHKSFSEIFKESSVKTYCIHSKNENKSEDIAEFFDITKKDEIKVAIAVNMLNESFHCDDIKTISMFRGTQSIQVYMQQIGRALTTNANTPMIFDFVDNIHSIKELEDIIRCENNKEYTENDFIFQSFNNETDWFMEAINQLNKYTDLNSDIAYKEIIDYMDSNKLDNIFDIKNNNEQLFDWVIKVLTQRPLKLWENNSNELAIEIYNRYWMYIDILNNLGVNWYNTFKRYIINKEEIDNIELKKFRSIYNKALLLNNLSAKSINYFMSLGVVSDVKQNTKKLVNLLTRNEPKLFKFKAQLLDFENIIKSDNNYDKYRVIFNLNKALNEDENRQWASNMGADATAFWLWKNYNKIYYNEIKEVVDKFTNIAYIEEFCNKAKRRESVTLDKDTIYKVDQYFGNIISIDEMDPDVKYMISLIPAKTMDKLYMHIMQFIGLTINEKSFKDKFNYQLTLDTFDRDYKEYVLNFKRSITNVLNMDKYNWSFRVIDKYNSLVNICDSLIDYMNNDKNTKSAWIWEYAKSVKSEFVASKSKKYNIDSGMDSKKLYKLLESFTKERVCSEIKEKYRDDFLVNYDIAYNNWVEKYGDDDINSAIISLVALSKSQATHNIDSTNNISLSLAKLIITFFDWLKTSEKNNDTNLPGYISNIKNAIEQMGKDTMYLFTSGLSKTNRAYYIRLYNNYINSTRFLNTSLIDIIINATTRDTQLFKDVEDSKYIEKYCKELIEFNNLIHKTYNMYGK